MNKIQKLFVGIWTVDVLTLTYIRSIFTIGSNRTSWTKRGLLFHDRNIYGLSSCGSLAGVAAYVKTIHPDWSASAVKSAIMTTAWAMNASKNAEAEFAYGAGYVNPSVTVDLGLVYEIAKEDYLNMLCSLDYSSKGISTVAGGTFTCSEKYKLNIRNLNYPSMAAKVSSSSFSDITFSRTVTNVGKKGSTYKAKLSGNPKLSIKVEPDNTSI